MNEKLYEVLETVRSTAVTVGEGAVNVACAAGKKASEMIDTAKLNIRIAQREADVEAAMCQLGELLYATHIGNPTDSDVLLEKMQEIDALKAEIAQMNEQRGQVIVPICGTCGAIVKEGDSFCRECGDEL